MLSCESLLRRRCLIWATIVVVGLAAILHAWFLDQHLAFVSTIERPDHPIQTPLQRIRPGYTADVSMWIRFALEGLEGKEALRSHHTSVDNPPHGRAVHWNSGLTWWIAGLGWGYHKVGGVPLSAAVERAAVWANLPLLLGFAIGFGVWAGRRAGALAGVVVVFGMIGHRSFYEGFSPAYPDHHGLITAATFGLMLGALFMGGGWIRGAGTSNLAFLPVDQKSARLAAAWSGFWGGFGLWISTASLTPPLVLVAVSGILATIACHRSLTATGARLFAGVWRTWGRVGALTSLGFYLLEYFPHQLGMRLEVNHPLYALAWWAGAELTATFLEFLTSPPDRRSAFRRSLLLCCTWALPAVLAPALVILWRGPAAFGLLDPFMAQLHKTIMEFQPLSSRIAASGINPLVDLVLIYPLLYVAAAFALFLTARPMRFVVILMLVPALGIQGLALLQSRWCVSLGAAQVPLLLTLLSVLVGASVSATQRRRWCVALLVMVVFFVPLPVKTAANLAINIVGGIVPGDETKDLVYREMAQAIRNSQPEGEIVVFASPNASLNLGYFGRFRTLGTLYWENGEGLKAAAALCSAPSEETAEAIIRRLGVTHLAVISTDNYVAEYAELLKPGLIQAELEQTFGFQVLVLRRIPLWLEPLPYRPPHRLPGDLADFDAILYKVNFDQSPVEAHARLGTLLAMREQMEDALSHFAEVGRLAPLDPAPWLRSGEIYLRMERWREAAESFDRGIDVGLVEERYKLLTQAAIAFEQSHRFREAIGYYRRALGEKPTNDVALNNLAWRLATIGDTELQSPDEALLLAERCVAHAPEDAANQNTLAAALAANGRLEEAIAVAEKSLALAGKSGDQALVRTCTRHLVAYRAGRPWRE